MKTPVKSLTATLFALTLASVVASLPVHAHTLEPASAVPQAIRADSHAPIGVMGDHRHAKGEWMISYRFMHMDMDGNLQGDNAISPDQIVASLAHPFAGPDKVRVVPTSMRTDMHMLGMMYAPSDRLTLMLMLNYLETDMRHITYDGMMGSTRLGTFAASNNGLGDTSVSALWGLVDHPHARLHLNFGLSLPTGSIDEQGTALAPTGMRMTMRMPYAMQLGSGTYDLKPGLTYSGDKGLWTWGAQYLATLRLGRNDEDYSLGDKQALTAWGSYLLHDGVSASLRASYAHTQDIDGDDAQIRAPVQTANPANYGGDNINLGLGINLVGQTGVLRGHRLAVEYQLPIHQDANGVQMEMDSMLTVGYQYAY